MHCSFHQSAETILTFPEQRQVSCFQGAVFESIIQDQDEKPFFLGVG